VSSGMEKNYSVIALPQLLFYVYFTVMLCAKGIGLVDGTMPFKVALVVSSLCVLIKIAIEKHTIIEYLFIALLLGLGLLIWQNSGNQSAIVMFFLIVSMKDVSERSAFKYASIIWSAAFFFQILTHLLNIRNQDFVIHNKYGLGYIIRWALGYSHPNVLQIAYAVLIAYILFSMLFRGKQLIRFIIISCIGAIYFFLFSISLTGIIMYFLLIMFYVVFVARLQIGRTIGSVEKVILNIIFPCAVLSSIVLPLILQGEAFDFVNKVMQTRPSLTKYFLTTYNLTLFGLNYEGLFYTYNLDSSYPNLLVNSGIIAFCFLMTVYILMIRKTINDYSDKKDIYNAAKLAIIFSFCIAGISEPFFFNISYKNVTLIFFAQYVWDNIKKVRGKEYQILKISRIFDISYYKNRLESICNSFNDFGNHVAQHKGIFVIIIAFSIGMGIVIGNIVYNEPNSVYALRKSCDTEDDTQSIFLSVEEANALREDSNVWFLNYEDENAHMLRFDGNITKIDKYRTIITFSIGFLLFILMINLISYNASMRKNK
jgi:hypothetical protein